MIVIHDKTKGNKMKSSLTVSPLQDAKSLVDNLTATHEELLHRLQALEVQKAAQGEHVSNLESRRAETIESITHGSGSEDALVKARKELTVAKDRLADTTEIHAITTQRITGLARDIQQARVTQKSEESRAWRHASSALNDQHRETLQLIMDRIFVAFNGHQPGVQYFSLVNTLGLRFPTAEDQTRIREELMAEFNI